MRAPLPFRRMTDIITRFAPSPTGHLHVGGARTALFCWAYAKGRGGRFLLRIEDTDQARSSESSTRGILEDLAWLGIDWDEGPEFDAGLKTPTAEDSGRWHGEQNHGDGKLGGDPRHVGPFYQAQRIEVYNQWIERMIEQDLAYPAFETSEELDAKRKAVTAGGGTYRYDRAALDVPREQRVARMRAGEPHVVRFRFPDEPVHVADVVLGDIAFDASHVDDFVLRKADGFPTYHFAVVLDDELMGVTHVLRGQEHLNNTPRHVALQKALGFRTPVYAHLPLIFTMDGAKMSKREKDKAAREACKKLGLDAAGVVERLLPQVVDAGEIANWLKDSRSQLDGEVLTVLASRIGLALPEVTVEDFRRAGYLPEVVCNFIALLGWSPGMKDAQGRDVEKFDMAFLCEHFDLPRIGKTNSRFDRVKLLAFNADGIAAMDDGEFTRRWRAWCEVYAPRFTPGGGERGRDRSPNIGQGRDATGGRGLTSDQFDILARAVRPRSKTFVDAAERAMFAVVADDAIVFDAKAVDKVLRKGSPTGLEVLREVRVVLAGVEDFSPEGVAAAVEAFATSRGLGMGVVAQPLRVALTGTTVSPGLGETLAVLGRESVLARIDRCVRECV